MYDKRPKNVRTNVPHSEDKCPFFSLSLTIRYHLLPSVRNLLTIDSRCQQSFTNDHFFCKKRNSLAIPFHTRYLPQYLVRCRPPVSPYSFSITFPVRFYNYNFLLLFSSDTRFCFSHVPGSFLENQKHFNWQKCSLFTICYF